jgi:hypothetical protein
MSPFFFSIVLLHFLAIFPTPNLAQSKQFWSFEGNGWDIRVQPWPTKFLPNWNEEFEKEDLVGWFCATENTKFKGTVTKKTLNGMPWPGTVQIRSDGM